MDNKQTLMTAGFVGVGSVALAYFGHSYLTKKDKPVTEMDKASDTVDKSLAGSMTAVILSKENVKIEINRFSTDPVTEGKAIKETVGKAIGSFSGFFRQDDAAQETVTEEK